MAAAKHPNVTRAGRLTAGAKSPGSDRQAAHSAADPKRPSPQQSLEKAKRTFANFSLSRFAKDALPANFVHPASAKDPAAVQNLQKDLITQQLDKLPDTDPQNRGMTFAFPVAKLAEMQKSLPGIGKDGGNIQLADLLNYMQGKMNGTVFYANGNPVLKRLTAETQFRSQARTIVASIMNRSGAAQAGTAQPALPSKPATQKLAPPNQKLAPPKKGGPKR